MTDKSRHGDVVFVSDGKYKEIEKAVLAPAYESIKGEGPSAMMKRKVPSLLGPACCRNGELASQAFHDRSLTLVVSAIMRMSILYGVKRFQH
jgi:hypothetical protein